jgi:hypothetical protein
MATKKRATTTPPKGMRWLAEPGFVWQVFDQQRFCVGAWSKEAPARAAFAKLRKGAELVTCKDYGGYPPMFMGHMKREALTSEVK